MKESSIRFYSVLFAAFSQNYPNIIQQFTRRPKIPVHSWDEIFILTKDPQTTSKRPSNDLETTGKRPRTQWNDYDASWRAKGQKRSNSMSCLMWWRANAQFLELKSSLNLNNLTSKSTFSSLSWFLSVYHWKTTHFYDKNFISENVKFADIFLKND